ncbi:RNA polymerase sigma factor [Persicitalea jodogahamensis]
MSLQASSETIWPEGQDLWKDFKAGDRAAFDFLYKTNIQQLIGYGYTITSNRNVIQDCVQDLFVELWESRASVAQANSIRHYLLKSLRYKIVRQLKADRSETLDEIHYPVLHDNAESTVLLQETSQHHSKQLSDALGHLPKRQREAIYLRYFQELSNEEVAQVMGVNYQSACKFIYTALKNLRERMQLSVWIPFFMPFFAFFKDYFK